MKKIPLGLLVLSLVACSTEPRPLNYGTDSCFVCKMTLMDNKFGSEIVTRKGKLYVFDDLNCMLSFYHSGEESPDQFAHVQVINYAQPSQLIDAHHALYIKSDQIRSPMASGIAAFTSEADCRKYNLEWKGILMSWGEIMTQFK